MSENVVYFAHGKESGPWGEKITHLAAIAKGKGFAVESPDYSSTMDPDQRVEQLLRLKPQADRHLVLVGSSMGGYVATVASARLKVSGLFLMAPAFFIEGYKEQSPQPYADHTVIVHGWADDVVPMDHSIRFAKEHAVELHIVKSDHRLTSALPKIGKLFETFLDEVLG